MAKTYRPVPNLEDMRLAVLCLVSYISEIETLLLSGAKF